METLTFLFTDIEGSTALLRRLGEGVYAQVLADHHSLIRSCLTAHEGDEVGTHGDAFFAVFSSPKACVAAVAYGGQVLLSETAAALVRDALPPGTALRDLGAHRLKDLGRPEQIFQLDAAGLQAGFPPLRSLGNPALPDNLPAQLATFVAGQLHSIAQVFLDRTGECWQEPEARYRDGSLSEVRSALGEVQFGRAGALGKTLSLDQVLDLARGTDRSARHGSPQPRHGVLSDPRD